MQTLRECLTDHGHPIPKPDVNDVIVAPMLPTTITCTSCNATMPLTLKVSVNSAGRFWCPECSNAVKSYLNRFFRR
jgi:transposase-like protein